MACFTEITKHRVLILDGAFGTMIQKNNFKEEDFRGREFISHSNPLKGFNDILNITKPSAIKKIHTSYLEAGANIITTNTFNANSVSMQDYALHNIEGLVKRLNREGVKLAKEAIVEYEKTHKGEVHFVGGSVGPTNRSLSMSPDIADPLKRNISYSQLFQVYSEQIEGLIEGGVDLLIFETFFDTLNLKAALDAANHILNIRRQKLPIMVSATISDNAGRILSGQTLHAFIASISHYDNVVSIGINCGFGPDRMINYIHNINQINPLLTSCHPNAGLPDEKGCYNVSPEEFVESLMPLLENHELNIVGGCCGTTPDFIREVSKKIKEFKPRQPIGENNLLKLSGLDMLSVEKFLIVGERCNVAGSAKFLRLIKEKAYEEAAEIAKAQIRNGAEVIDINMDDAMLDAQKEMVDFLRYILAEPEIAKVPFMIDSSKWPVIESALQEIQGKGIVNSLSLKEGESNFIKKALRVKELGFALVVMAFDEKGQADTFQRKVEIVKRSYDILTGKCGYNPEDIIFDVNVMTIATGMKEHAQYAIDFIDTVKWISTNLPGVRTSGGISNLSFAFRGKNLIREYMHEIFLYHAKNAGLSMAIINPAKKFNYDDIPGDIRDIIEDIIFDRDEKAVDKLIEIANSDTSIKNDKPDIKQKESINLTIEELLKNDLIKGELLQLEDHIKKALDSYPDPVKLIEGPLLDGMKEVGVLFGEGKMFLPQVVKTARSMKKAVEILTPFIEKNNKENGSSKSGKILIATVKGDVHDIGKNIVATVLSCNNYEIIDLGIMVSPEAIADASIKEKPDIICLSGLITPSLSEMVETVKKLEEYGINVPVMVGGAATSLLHTALKISPYYSGLVLHMSDASQNPIAAAKLLNPQEKEEYAQQIRDKYSKLCENRESYLILPFKNVLEIVHAEDRNNFDSQIPKLKLGIAHEIKFQLENLIPLINWKMYYHAWKIDSTSEEAHKLQKDTQEILNYIQTGHKFTGSALFRFEKAKADEKNIYLENQIYPMLRQQREGSSLLSCCDFIGKKQDYIGFFALTAGHGLMDMAKDYEQGGDTYKQMIVQTLSDRLAEASAEWLMSFIRENYWDVTIRPAWGYPMLPDQLLIHQTQEILPYEEIGISLTENGAMYPPSSISGLLISNPESKYFMIGEIGEDQIEDYAKRRGISKEKMKQILRQI